MSDGMTEAMRDECGGEEFKVAVVYSDPNMAALAARNAQATRTPSALDTQVGGGHYKSLKIQPAEYCHANRIEKLEGDVIAYVTRWRNKNGVEDLKKARHTLDLLIELETRNG